MRHHGEEEGFARQRRGLEGGEVNGRGAWASGLKYPLDRKKAKDARSGLNWPRL
jgi:hypothetical protein